MDATSVDDNRQRVIVLGAAGQVGRQLLTVIPEAIGWTRADLDLADSEALEQADWADVDVVVNAAAMTAVDDAESPTGRRRAWAVNAIAPARLAALAAVHGFTLVHFSSDYVFDGATEVHDEGEAFSPLGVYGQSKAAGDLAVSVAPRHYVLRTSWVVGEGGNFVDTMARMADSGVSPSVVDDQFGRLTFVEDLAGAAAHLISVAAPFGTYNCSNSGETTTWAEVARRIFVLRGRSAFDVTGVSTQDYGAGRPMSPRPRQSTLDLVKLGETGFVPRDQWSALDQHVARLPASGTP